MNAAEMCPVSSGRFERAARDARLLTKEYEPRCREPRRFRNRDSQVEVQAVSSEERARDRFRTNRSRWMPKSNHVINLAIGRLVSCFLPVAGLTAIDVGPASYTSGS